MLRVISNLTTEQDWRLVTIAGVVCFLASLTAVRLFNRACAGEGRARSTWIVLAGVAGGCGIWTTHVIAMLAHDPGLPVAYNVSWIALSLVVAVAVSMCGLAIAAYGQNRRGAALIGGGIVGAAIACAYVLGMWALVLPGRVTWSFDLVLASIVIGVLLGALALAVAVHSVDQRGSLAAAILLTLAIVFLHVIATSAVAIVPDPARVVDALSWSPTALATVAAGAALAILTTSLVTALADHSLDKQSVLLSTALNNMSQGLLMLHHSGRVIVCNDRYLEMYGLPAGSVTPGTPLRDVLSRRKAAGTFSGDPRHIRRQRSARGRRGQGDREGRRVGGPHDRHREPADGGRRLGLDP